MAYHNSNITKKQEYDSIPQVRKEIDIEATRRKELAREHSALSFQFGYIRALSKLEAKFNEDKGKFNADPGLFNADPGKMNFPSK